MENKAHALARDELIRVLTAYKGITTEDGLGDGTTLIDFNLMDNPSISKDAIPEKTILITSGAAIQEDKGAASFDNDTGKITLQGTGFSVQIEKGTTFRILNISSTEIDVARIEAKVDTIDGVADSIIADYLAHGTWGLNAIVDLINACGIILGTLDTRTATIVTGYLAHGTWGLNAIVDLINALGPVLNTLDTRTATIVTGYLAHGTWGLNAIVDLLNIANAIIPDLRSNLVRFGQITAVSDNTFTSPDLTGLGIDAMHGWWVYVFQADDAAPEGEYRMMTDYTNEGVVSHNAFSTALEVGDRVQLIHPLLYEPKAMRGGAETLESLDDELDAVLDIARGSSGAVSVDGGEDDLYNESNANEFVLLELRVDLNNMAEGDTIVFKVYTTEDGTERKISDDAANTFTGAQDPARVEIIGSANQVWGREGIRVCAVKMEGTTREVTAFYRDAKRGS